MTNPSRTYLLVEERLGSDLRKHVAKLRRAGESWNSIAHDLSDRTEVVITDETLRIWFRAMPKGATAGAA